MSLNESLTNFKNGISEINGYIQIAYEPDSEGNDRFSVEEKEFLVSSAFLKMFIKWEEFLESVFLQYLLGEPSISGDKIVCFALPNDIEHAYKLILGTQRYIDWSNPDIVLRLSKIFFDNGDPFNTAISSIKNDLIDLKNIRNSAAHKSNTTQTKLHSVASRKLGTYVSNIGVAEFITSFSLENPNQTILQSYQLQFEIAAENIASNST